MVTGEWRPMTHRDAVSHYSLSPVVPKLLLTKTTVTDGCGGRSYGRKEGSCCADARCCHTVDNNSL